MAMRKRQLKKFAKNKKNQARIYGPASTKGSKKLVRRWKTMCRYWSGGGSHNEVARVTTIKLKEFEQKMKSPDFDPKNAYQSLMGLMRRPMMDIGPALACCYPASCRTVDETL
jgi:hypothetical protein